MQTRRQFVAAAGTAAAAAILAPEALGPARAPRRSPAAGASRRASCRASRRRARSRCGRALHDVGGSVTAELEVARDREFRRVVARKQVATSGAKGHALKARVTGPEGARAVLLPLLDADDGRARSGASGPRCRPTPGSRCTSRSGPARTSPTASTTRTTLLAAEDLDFVVCLGDYIYAETEETRRDRGARRPDRQHRARPARARRSRSTTTARSTASTAPTRPSAACTPASRP